MKRTLVCVFFVALTAWASNELVPPFGFRWGDPPRRVESVLTGAKAHIVDRKQDGNRESWTVDGLIHPGLQRTLWIKLVTALTDAKRARALAGTFDGLSAATEVTPAQIKFAVLAGLFAARADNQPLNARHLLIGLDRELAKEGRAIGPRDRDKILAMAEAA